MNRRHAIGFGLIAFVVLAPPLLKARIVVERASSPEPGTLLVARRELPDRRFAESVVLLVRHGPEGSLGVIINRPLAVTLDTALPDLPGELTRPHALNWGGPVLQDHLSFLGRGRPVPETVLFVVDGVYFGGRVSVFEDLLAADDARGRLRVYAGHSGWAPGQLQAEIDRDDWFLVTLNEDMVFDITPEALWPALIDRLDPRGVVDVAAPSRTHLAVAP